MRKNFKMNEIKYNKKIIFAHFKSKFAHLKAIRTFRTFF